ncbi:ABC transporter ATP-binding protein [Heliorestis acidaminivorans]|uniref:ABC transporter ATP-binding protein n=1 Tax=Heliorestis acidaminivorans TaxID=553427 RepID=A0A6I0EVP1_9FIRM|nr:ABC transporter ATP-binding protein [Heliorestis acidaminivorans]KAB2953659.1 ABC transporter ATP-binding protein [Heliorestis acidaminivorans]
MSLIIAKDICHVYDSGERAYEALKKVNMSISEGEFVALVGPSGSGKSTLLSILGVLTKASSGIVQIDGIDVTNLGEEERARFRREYVGFVFQQFHLMPYLTALENVMLPLVMTSISKKEQKEKARLALAKVGLEEKGHRLPAQLSGGEQERVAIARAIVNEPPLLLADEPTGALDVANGNRVMALLTDLNKQGHTIVMVTHNPAYEPLAHRVIRLQDGAIVEGSGSLTRPGEVS